MAAQSPGDLGDSVSVVICAYTERRWDQMVAGARAALDQSGPSDEVLLVIDYNDELERRARQEFTAEPRLRVLPNTETKGLSGARNTAVAQSNGAVIAFLDDDALPNPGWLAGLTAPIKDSHVEVVGGRAVAAWQRQRPSWFPEEFDWVVGCSHRGLPEQQQDVRNVIGCSMLFRRDAFERSGLFSTTLGRVGIVPEGCEETEICIRIRRDDPQARVVYVPESVVRHSVSADRERAAYFLSRCVAEGKSKAAVARLSSLEQSTSSELDYTLRVLPRAFARYVGHGLRGDTSGWQRAAFLVVGLAATTASFAFHTARLRRRSG